MRALLGGDEVSGLTTVIALTPDKVDREWIHRRIYQPNSPLSLDFFHLVADRLVFQMVGMPRWTLERLWQQTIGSWTILDGELLAGGLDVLTLTPDRASHAVLAAWRCLHEGNPDGWKRFERDLRKEPRREVLRQAEARREEAVSGGDAGVPFAVFQQLAQRSKAAPTPTDSTVVMPGRDTL